MHILRTTVDSAQGANLLVQTLIEAGAACVQVGEIVSHYKWQGKLETGREWCLDAKVTSEALPACRAALATAHPYEVPLIASWSITMNDAYLAWARQAV